MQLLLSRGAHGRQFCEGSSFLYMVSAAPQVIGMVWELFTS